MPQSGSGVKAMITDKVIAAKQAAVQQFLTLETSPVAFRAMVASVAPEHNVVGVGIGRKFVKGKATAKTVVRLYVDKKIAASAIPKAHLLPEEINGVETDVIEAGAFFAFATAAAAAAVAPQQGRFRPAKPGSSIGFKFLPPDDRFVMAGTFGALVAKGNDRFVLSNNHVLANENRQPLGSAIYQPGLLDGGDPTTDEIAKLTQFVRLQPNAPNTVDCAIAKLDGPKLATATFLPSVGKLKSGTPLVATANQAVMKVGRTTRYTTGVIFDLSADVKVGYDIGTLQFTDQILIKSTTSKPFSAAGDSGSLIVDKKKKQPVGLLFAGSTQFTIANHIGDVLSALGVTILA
jgi:hypothetical protein